MSGRTLAPRRLQLSKHGLDFIARHEGLRLEAYRAAPGEEFLTIGYGHYGADVHEGEQITKTRALTLLQGDVKDAEAAVRRMVATKVTQAQYDCLVSFVFNIGEGNFSGSTLLRELNEGHPARVPHQLKRWVHGADGEVLAGLVTRREDEAHLWHTGEYRKDHA